MLVSATCDNRRTNVMGITITLTRRAPGSGSADARSVDATHLLALQTCHHDMTMTNEFGISPVHPLSTKLTPACFALFAWQHCASCDYRHHAQREHTTSTTPFTCAGGNLTLMLSRVGFLGAPGPARERCAVRDSMHTTGSDCTCRTQ